LNHEGHEELQNEPFDAVLQFRDIKIDKQSIFVFFAIFVVLNAVLHGR